ncbi:Predicted membrane protein [Chlamydia trachomatis]|nr:Predicted membrane protein [Chlamydia trachomatis]
MILKEHDNWTEETTISQEDLTNYQVKYLRSIIESANKKNEYVRETVYDVSRNSQYETVDVQEEWEQKATLGQRIADEVARFGGSWTFIVSFVVLMAVWMSINVLHPWRIQFDAYPFILLNLALSTIAALQAPLIMMSQNRASDYDRFQAKNDYRVNKRSEEGVRLLHKKIDHLVQQDQTDLLEIQKLQTEMLASLSLQMEALQKQQEVVVKELERREKENV